MIIFVSRLVLCTLLWINVAHARFATYEDASLEYDFYNRDVIVNLDGSSEEVIEQQITILKEPARDEYGNYSIYYNADANKFTLLSAKTIYKNQDYIVAPNMIEDKPVANNTQGFDKMHRVLIGYPKVEIGSTLYLKYRLKIEKPPVDNFYATNFYFGLNSYWKNSNITIRSALPFHLTINDPNKSLLVTKTQAKNLYLLTLKQQKPCYYETINEASLSYLEQKYLTWVELSTLEDITELGQRFTAGYEKRIQEALPPLFHAITTDAGKLSNEIDQINFIIIKLIGSVRYLGDWRSIKGRFYPQPLALVAKQGSGDCKDFSTILVSILRKLGYKANTALVYRGQQYLYEEETPLPTVNKFNHVIVKAQGKTGTIYWLDPTNFVSMVNGIFPDIANRKALVLHAEKPTYEFIPSINADHAGLLHESRSFLAKDDVLNSTGSITLRGEKAIPLTGATLTQSEKSIKEQIINFLSHDTVHLEKAVELPDLKSRIVKDIKIGYSFMVRNNTLLTAFGDAYIIPTNNLVNVLMSVPEEQVSALYLDIPNKIQKKLLLIKADPSNIESLNSRIDSKWFKASRTYSKTTDGVLLEENIEVLNSFILNSELKSSEFKTIQTTLKKYFKDVAVIIKPAA